MSDLIKPAFTAFAGKAIDFGMTYSDFVRTNKREFIQQIIDRNHGNLSHAARELGMHRNTLARTLHELDMHPPRRNAKSEHAPEASVA